MGTVKYTGPVASFHCPTNADIRSLKVHFSPKQEGTGDPSPENVRPIVGWDGISSKGSSKNLFDTSKVSCSHPSTSWNASTETEDMVFANGELSGTVQSGWRDVTVFSQNIPFAPGTYTLSFDYINGIKNYSWRPVVITATYSGWFTAYKSVPSATQDSGHIETTFTADKPFYVAICLNSFDYAATIAKNKVYNIQLELGSIATSFELCKISTTNYEFGVLGKNKFDKSQSINGRIMKTNGTNYTAENGYYISSFIPVVVGASYTKNSPIVDAYHRFATYSSDDVNTFIRVFDTSNTITIEPGENYIRFCGETSEMDTAQLELGSTTTVYEPYDPKHTVYGGWVDLISGEVCEEWKIKDLGECTWIHYGSRDSVFYTKTLNNLKVQSAPDTVMSTHYKYEGAPNVTTMNELTISDSQQLNRGNVNICDPNYSEYTVEQFKEAMSGVMCAYKAVNTTIYHLAPTQLQTFLGKNNVWSNADYVEIEYDLHETQDILARKQFIIANQPHIEKLAAAPLQNFVADMAAPLKECKVYFQPVQEGSGDPSPDNVRAISGWTGLDIYMASTNLWDEQWELGDYNGGNGNPKESSSIIRSTNYIAVEENMTYCFNCSVDCGVWPYDINYNAIQLKPGSTGYFWQLYRHSPTNITIPEGVKYVKITSAQNGTYQYPINFSYPSTIETYEPYRGQTIPLNWTNDIGIIYGGYVDLITGEVWKTYHHMIINKTSQVGIFPWLGINTDSATGEEFTAVLWKRTSTDPKAKGYNNLICYCDQYPYHSLGSSTRVMNTAGMYDGDSYGPSLLLPTSLIGTTSESLATFMEDKTFNFVYLMRTPELVTTLTPTQLKSLIGQNNIWSNANGNIEVSYWKH